MSVFVLEETGRGVAREAYLFYILLHLQASAIPSSSSRNGGNTTSEHKATESRELWCRHD